MEEKSWRAKWKFFPNGIDWNEVFLIRGERAVDINDIAGVASHRVLAKSAEIFKADPLAQRLRQFMPSWNPMGYEIITKPTEWE